MTEPGFLIALVLGGVAGVGGLLHRRGSMWILSAAVAASAALMIGGRLDGLVAPSVGLTVVAAVVVGLASLGGAQISRRNGADLAFACVVLAVLGVWGTVPDTENATVLLGGVIGAALGALRIRSAIPAWSWIPIVTITATLAVTEGQGRVSAPIGALAGLGVLIIHPAVDRMRGVVPDWLLLSSQVALVIFGGRVAGRAETAIEAGVLALLGLALGTGLLVGSAHWLGGGRRPT